MYYYAIEKYKKATKQKTIFHIFQNHSDAKGYMITHLRYKDLKKTEEKRAKGQLTDEQFYTHYAIYSIIKVY